MLSTIECIRVKLERAKKHIQELDAELGSFFASNPYPISYKRDPETRRLIYYVKNTRAVPPILSAISGDAIQNIRSSLDYLAVGLFRSIPQNDNASPKRIYFPIFDSVRQYKSDGRGAIPHLRRDAAKLIDAVEPYKGGAGHILWVLHRLSIVDKHRMLVMIGSAYGIGIGDHMQRMAADMNPIFEALNPPDLFIGPKNVVPLVDGHELFTDAPDAKPNAKMRFRFFVAFAEPGILDLARPAGHTLAEMLKFVASILPRFEPFL
jgi:hypothetical protein